MEARGLGEPGDNARLADRAALDDASPASSDVDKSRLVKGTGRSQARESLDFSVPGAWSPGRKSRASGLEHASRSQADHVRQSRTSPPRTVGANGRWTT